MITIGPYKMLNSSTVIVKKKRICGTNFDCYCTSARIWPLVRLYKDYAGVKSQTFKTTPKNTQGQMRDRSRDSYCIFLQIKTKKLL